VELVVVGLLGVEEFDIPHEGGMAIAELLARASHHADQIGLEVGQRERAAVESVGELGVGRRPDRIDVGKVDLRATNGELDLGGGGHRCSPSIKENTSS
jgi:hypothetical protein